MLIKVHSDSIPNNIGSDMLGWFVFGFPTVLRVPLSQAPQQKTCEGEGDLQTWFFLQFELETTAMGIANLCMESGSRCNRSSVRPRTMDDNA